MLVKYKLLLALGSYPSCACSVISVPSLGACLQMGSIGLGECPPVTGLDTENSFSFPAPILWAITFPSFSHALFDMGSRKEATCRRDPCPREVQSPGEQLVPCPREWGWRGWLPSFNLSSPPVPALETAWLILGTVGKQGSFLVSHGLIGRPEN